MERLQEAVLKARDRRMALPSIESGPDDRRASLDIEAAWSALTPHTREQRALEANRIFAAKMSRSSTPYDILRTKVLLTMQKNGWKRLAITSPTSGCGKTTTACNLAMGFSRHADMRVILVELDLRRPKIASVLGLPEIGPIDKMLTGEHEFSEQAVRFRDNVAIAASGAPVTDPTALLVSKATHHNLARIEQIYAPDLIIFDLPPMLVTDDAHSFLKNVDCALMVAKAGHSTVAQIDICEREIAEQTNALGVTLNQYRYDEDAFAHYDAFKT